MDTEQLIAEAYGRHSQQYASIIEPIIKPMAAELAALAASRAPERLLDLATGTGVIARSAAEAGVPVIGIDISLGALTRAAALSDYSIPFVAGDVHSLPFSDCSFDGIACGISLTHFTDVSAVLHEILRLLQPGGWLTASAWGEGGANPTKAAAVEVRNRYLEDIQEAYQGALAEDLWADIELGKLTVGEAGFVDIQVTTRLFSGRYPGEQEAVEAALAWPLTRYRMDKLDPSNRKNLEEETAAAIHEVSDLTWSSEVHYYLARRPY